MEIIVFRAAAFEGGCDRLITRNPYFLPASRPRCPEETVDSWTTGATLRLSTWIFCLLRLIYTLETPILHTPLSNHQTPVDPPLSGDVQPRRVGDQQKDEAPKTRHQVGGGISRFTVRSASKSTRLLDSTEYFEMKDALSFPVKQEESQT